MLGVQWWYFFAKFPVNCCDPNIIALNLCRIYVHCSIIAIFGFQCQKRGTPIKGLNLYPQQKFTQIIRTNQNSLWALTFFLLSKQVLGAVQYAMFCHAIWKRPVPVHWQIWSATANNCVFERGIKYMHDFDSQQEYVRTQNYSWVEFFCCFCRLQFKMYCSKLASSLELITK